MSIKWPDSWIRPAFDSASINVVLALTVIDLLLRPMGFWGIRAFLLLVSGLALIDSRILRAPVTWLVLTLLIALRLIDDWPLSDNHIYLLCYWCLTVFLSLISADGLTIIKKSSRMLIALSFLFAVLWKTFLSPEYLDGRFFRVTFLLDERFANTTQLFGGFTKEQFMQSREALEPLPEGMELMQNRSVYEPPAFQRLVKISTWGTLLAEWIVALVFLFPIARDSIRHTLLIAFCVITYAFAPVAGFGWLLLLMGLAQTDQKQRTLRALYLACYFLVLIYAEVPWSRLVVESLKA